jgi:hypothetical protein
MTDPGAIVQGLQSAKAAYQIVRGIARADQLISEAELKMRIAELAELLMQAQEGLLAAQQELLELRAENSRLKATSKGGKPVLRGNMYVVVNPSGEEEGPYCVRCYEVDRRLMPLPEMPPGAGLWEV